MHIFPEKGYSKPLTEPDHTQGYLMFTWNSMCGNITKLAVHPEQQRHGYGEVLLREAIAALRKVQSHKLQVCHVHTGKPYVFYLIIIIICS